MSLPVYSKCQLLWFRAVYGVIADSLREKLQESSDNDAESLHLLWRLGNVEYKAGSYSASIDYLQRLLQMAEDHVDVHGHRVRRPPNPDQNYKSRIHQHIGRNFMQMFLVKHDHEHLEKAFEHYRYAVEHMVAALDAMIELPSLLLEFGRVSEFYGAFEAAMAIYTKIVTNFPTFRGYFDVLYRIAIVGRQLASLSSNNKEIEEIIEKTLDILQFLLEALPTNIHNVHIVMLYARTFEISKNLQIKYRAPAVYSSLYDICKKKKLLGANETDEKVWLANPMTWFKLAEKIEADNENVVAKDAYNKFIDEAKRRASGDKELLEILDADACLKLAKHYAKYQNFVEAIRFGDMGLRANRFHKELRALMYQWSPKHREELGKDLEAVRKIINVWKGRCWSFGFIRRLKEFTLKELEARHKKNYFDKECREQLAYYARDKYRAVFHFEELCATRIKRAYRQHRKMWVWQEAQRRNIGNQASELHHRYSKKPYVPSVRDEVLKMVGHRFMPRKHPLLQVARHITMQNKALRQIIRCIKAYQIRSALAQKIEERQEKMWMEYSKYVIRIQTLFRRMVAKKKMEATRKKRAKQLEALMVLQRFWKRICSAPAFIEKRNMRKKFRLHNKAMLTFRRRLLPLIKRYLKRKRKLVDKLSRKSRKMLKKTRKSYSEQDILKAVIRIQRFYRKSVANFWMKVSRRAIAGRRQVGYSRWIVGQIPAMDMLMNDSIRFHNPGVDSHTNSFRQLLVQHTVLCHGLLPFDVSREISGTPSDKMTTMDYQLFSHVLRQPNSGIRRVILQNWDLTDERKLAEAISVFFLALSKCTSIQSLWIIGGTWSAKFVQMCFKLVQVDNPRIKEFCFEKITLTGVHADLVGQCGGRLLMDYFNYSIPALHTLSLHGCTLRDDQVELIVQGLEVNSAIRMLFLSLNFISDIGFLALFKAMNHNKRCMVEKLDLSYNLINCSLAVKEVLTKYRTRKHQKCLLEINFANNRILSPFDPLESAFSQKISPQLVIRYLDENTRRSEFFTTNISTNLQSLASSETTSFNDDSSIISSEDSVIMAPRMTILANSALVSLRDKKRVVPLLQKRSASMKKPPLNASNSVQRISTS